jgi:hypothetical protein
MEAGAAGGRIETAPKIQMMKDLLTSMGVEEADPKACPSLLARAPLRFRCATALRCKQICLCLVRHASTAAGAGGRSVLT